jgi:succinate dehydrogenase / fumarate reductase, membrane anchor subunit
MAIQTPIRRARGLGSAREGASHWKLQRLTAISNALLVLWFIFSVATFSEASYAAVAAWLARPLPAALMVLLLISVFWHARIGLQVIIEDYVHNEPARLASLVAVTLLTFGLGAACVVAVLKVSLGS